MVVHASFASSKPKVEVDTHADMCVVGDNCLVVHDHNRPVNVYSYDPKDGHRSAKTVDAAVRYQDPPSGQIFMISYLYWWPREPSSMPHAVLSEWNAYQWNLQVSGWVPVWLLIIELVNPFNAAQPINISTSVKW